MNKSAKSLSKNEFRAVCSYASDKRNGVRNVLLLSLMYYAGARIGECCAIRISDVLDHNNDVLSVIHLQSEQTKGNKSRDLHLSGNLVKFISDYLVTLTHMSKQKRSAYSVDKDAFLLQSERGGRMNTNGAVQSVSRWYKDIGINNATSHSGRKSFATDLSHSVDVRVLQTLLNHSSLNTTQLYIDTNTDMLKAAVNTVRK
jgi:integrase/recombinase XerD